jgi:hypothetical protein
MISKIRVRRMPRAKTRSEIKLDGMNLARTTPAMKIPNFDASESICNSFYCKNDGF